MAMLKIVDVITRNHVNIWIRQSQLAKKLVKINGMAGAILMYLYTRAFNVYDELDKKKEDYIYKALRTTFSLNPLVAFDKLMNRRWSHGNVPLETVKEVVKRARSSKWLLRREKDMISGYELKRLVVYVNHVGTKKCLTIGDYGGRLEVKARRKCVKRSRKFWATFSWKKESLKNVDKACLKPVIGRCNEQWEDGIVTAVNSDLSFEVDGAPRYTKNLRKRNHETD
ncbi:unnamed protein product [Lepeophtheirus salmonis]|uniref:(salmon louse) hypothetical protein n=1 Tax=Lepeophtheirus salmonis TaxID=72036 RepID=A0A7R8CMP0_LEPSM|nr:unnamed protein product [Lepeophtheirus salmonis]CAF2866897.1 unnamed protein product [Lepeophtheirus salmonis]